MNKYLVYKETCINFKNLLYSKRCKISVAHTIIFQLCNDQIRQYVVFKKSGFGRKTRKKCKEVITIKFLLSLRWKENS